MKKTFYIFLCMFLGAALLLIIQRALLAIYLISVGGEPAYGLLNAGQLQILNWGSTVLAVAVGLIYGNYLGHHWYPLVYGDPNFSNKKMPDSGNAGAGAEPMPKTVTIKPVRPAKSKVNLKSEIKDRVWDFDDLLNHDLPAVESLSGAAPAIASAVSLGEPVKKVVVRKSKKPAAKSSAKSKVKIKS